MSLVPDHLIPIHCEQLEPGMFVAELDRSWLHTPFDRRGFTITHAAQIEVLRRCCDYVYIDPAQSDELAVMGLDAILDLRADEPSHPSEDELLQLNGCREVLRDANDRIEEMVRAARRVGRLEVSPVDDNLDAFVEHVLDWPDAIQWLLMTEPAHGHLNRRSVGTAVFSILFGKQLGLDRVALRDLAFGALVLDIGKTSVPITILSKPKRLNSVERSFARRHVDDGLHLAQLSARMKRRAVDMIAAHHERMDGSGYPRHMNGTEIPLFARIAAIADTYDAMTQDRSYADARSGHEALRHLNTWRDSKFDAALVDEFILAIGVYPVGTSVKLMDGSVGVVCRQNTGDPKRPDVLLMRDSGGRALKTMLVIEPTLSRRIERALPAALTTH